MLQGEFTSIHGVQWKVQIVGTDLTGNLVLPADSPLTFEWAEKSKEDVICGCIATLKIESQSDRQFISLYTETVGSVRLDVYRNGSLWWSGCLDPEFYEEPYSRNKYYDVTLTFSDFGQLNRLVYNKTAQQLVSDILSDAITRIGINSSIDINTDYITTKFTSGSTITLSTLSIDSANFYDEESEASNLEEVIEGIFQPLAIKMVQRNGHIYLYDINGIASNLQQKEIYWDGADSVLGVDKVYNKAKITFSPYVDSAIIDCDYNPTVDTSDIGKDTDNVHTFYKGYHYDDDDEYDKKLEGDKDFSLFYNPTFDGVIVTNGKPICMRKIYGGEDCNFIASIYPIYSVDTTKGSETYNTFYYNYKCPYMPKHSAAFNYWDGSAYVDTTQQLKYSETSLFKTKKKLITVNNSQSTVLVLNIPILYDWRPNPYREASNTNRNGGYHDERIEICVIIRLYDADGNVLYHYENYGKCPNRADITQRGEWVAGDISTVSGTKGNSSIARLHYYTPSGLTSDMCTGGFIDNYQYSDIIEYAQHTPDVDPLVEAAPYGQYIPQPPVGGYIEVEVLNGLDAYYINNYNQYISRNPTLSYEGNTLNANLFWMVFAEPELSVHYDYSPYSTVESDDIEYSGVLDENAADDISLNTICGTSAATLPYAKGVLCDVNGKQLNSLTRNGVTDVAEHLLIGTLFSAYARRHTKLTGTARIEPEFTNYTDANTSEAFMSVGEEMDARIDETNITLVEVNTDSYHGITK